MTESTERELYLGMKKGTFWLTFSVVVLGMLVSAFIEFYQSEFVGEFFKASWLIEFERQHHVAMSWFEFGARTCMVAGMAIGFTTWIRHEVNRRSRATN